MAEGNPDMPLCLSPTRLDGPHLSCLVSLSPAEGGGGACVACRADLTKIIYFCLSFQSLSPQTPVLTSSVCCFPVT